MYIVQEIQTNDNGQIGILSYQYENKKEAESKYYLILSAAAVSTLPVHSAMLFTNEGTVVLNTCFRREIVPAVLDE